MLRPIIETLCAKREILSLWKALPVSLQMLSTPIGLAGFVVFILLFFSICLIQSNLLPPLTNQHSFYIIKIIVYLFFTLSLITIVLFFAVHIAILKTPKVVTNSSSEVNKSAGQTKSIADKKIDDGDKLRKFWKPYDLNININNQNAIKNWMRANNINDLSITSFIYSDTLSEARAQAVKDLSL